jgi:LysR family glycine cleavage system transcriptional activator
MDVLERLPSTKCLQVFVVVADVLNFTHAAEQLNMTQGAISRQILSLEELLGVSLFDRLTRKLKLTQSGELFLQHAQRVLVELQLAKSALSSNQNTVRICAPSCISSWLLQKIAGFQQLFPDYEVELTATTRHSGAADLDHFDLWIRYSETEQVHPYHSRLLFSERLSPVVSPTVWDLNLPARQQLESLTWLHPNSQQLDWKLWLAKNTEIASQSNTNQHFATLDQAVNAAVAGFGVAMGDVELARRDIELGRLLLPFSETVRSGKSYFISSLSERSRSAVEQFEHFLHQSEPVS